MIKQQVLVIVVTCKQVSDDDRYKDKTDYYGNSIVYSNGYAKEYTKAYTQSASPISSWD